MDILALVSDYVFSFIFQTIGIAIAVTIVSLVLYFVFSKIGWTRISEKDSKWLKLFLASGATIVGMIIGIVFGAQIAATNVSVKIIDDAGKLLINQALVQVAEPLQLDVNDEIDMSNVRLLIDSVENITITSGRGIPSMLVNSAFDLIRTPFTVHAGRYLSQVTSTGKIIPVKVVDLVWGKVMSSIKFSSNTIIQTRLYSLIFWLLFMTGFSVAFLSVVRFINSKIRRTA